MIHAPTTSSRAEPESQDTGAVLASIVISVVAVIVVYTVYFLYSRQFLAFRNSWTEFVFRTPLHPMVLVVAAINVLFAFVAISKRKWLNFFPAALAGMVLSPGIAWEGPGNYYKSIAPLINFLVMSHLYMSLIAWLMVALWVTHLNAVVRRLSRIRGSS